MIRRYEPTESVFKHNKYVLHPLLSRVNQIANGMYELEMDLKKGEIINNRDFVVAPTPNGEQPFRVYRIKKTLTGKKVFARHKFYDLADAFLVDTRPTNATVQDALQEIFTDVGWTGWTYLSDITDRRTAYYVRKNPVEAIIGAENSILNTWGGYLVRDNSEVKILAEGLDRGFEIRLGKNLLGIEDDSDESSVVTRLYPTVVIDQVVYALPEEYVDSPLIGSYPHPIIKEVRVALSDDESALPIEDIYTIMRNYCQNLYSVDNLDKPVVNYKVDFLQLKNIARMDQELKYTVAGLEQLAYSTIETLTYAQLEGTEVINEFIDMLEQLDIHDQVTIRVKELDIDIKASVISYVYDCLNERYVEIELGGFKPSNKYQTESIIQKLSNDLDVSKDEIAKLWDVAVNTITGNKGGYKVERLNANKQPYETLYMDTPDINTAVNVLRINNAGIAGSSNGFNGPYDVAITTDGWIVAERILAYTLSAISADLGTVTAGKIQNADSSVLLDLDNGTFSMGGKSGQVAKHTAAESIFNHSDGSYTKISSAGLEIYKSGLNKKYKALVHSGKTLSNSYPGAVSSGQVLNVTLPIEFDSLTDLKIYAWISRAKQSTGTNTIRSMEAVISDIEKGIDNRIRFKVTWSVVFNGSADATTGEVSYMAIA